MKKTSRSGDGTREVGDVVFSFDGKEFSLPFDEVRRVVGGLGVMGGEDAEMDPAKAFKILRMAADRGHSLPLYTVGEMYAHGHGVKRNIPKAASYCGKAAEAGIPEAAYAFGTFSADGTLVRKDAKTAARWFRKAAEEGLPEAQCRFAVACRDGEGVERDRETAVEWLQKAAARRSRSALCTLISLGRAGRVSAFFYKLRSFMARGVPDIAIYDDHGRFLRYVAIPEEKEEPNR